MAEGRRLPCRVVMVLATALALSAARGRGQESSQAPLTPPPEHDVRRLSTEPEPPAPPSLPPEEIIRRFSQKEDQYLAVRPMYGYRKSIRIDEFDRDGKQVGQYLMITEVTRASNGQVISKVVQKPQSTLHAFTLEAEDVKDLDRIPAFPLTTSQLAKYDLKYLGTEQVDEIDTYIFQVKPKTLERTRAYFEGIVWVDSKYLEVVKTYGKWVNELGDVHTAMLPFATFETYRENVDGKYWFPSYMRSEDTLHLKDTDVPMRLVIKWTEFKPLPAVGAAPQTPPASPQAPNATPPAPDKP
jgi:hypothetical protein